MPFLSLHLQALWYNNPFKNHVIVNIFAFYLGSLQMKNESKCFCLDQDTIIFIWPLSHISALFVPRKIPKEPFALASSLISHPKTEAKTRLESRAISIFSLVLRFLRGQKCQIFLLPTWFLTFPYVFTIIHLITPFSTFFKSLFHNLYIRVRLKIQIKMHIQPVIL